MLIAEQVETKMCPLYCNRAWGQRSAVSGRSSVFPPRFFLQERGCMRDRGCVAPHRVSGLPGHQCVPGHLCHARQGDGHHRVWSVYNLRRPGALPQASGPVSTKL